MLWNIISLLLINKDLQIKRLIILQVIITMCGRNKNSPIFLYLHMV